MPLLGKPCCWHSTTTGALAHGFIVAVRVDEKVQTSPSLYNIENSMCWRPLALINFSLSPAENALNLKAPVTPNMPQFQLASTQNNNAWEVYVKNLPTDVPENQIAADFSADAIEMRGNNTALLRFNTKRKAEDSISWDCERYHGRYINVRWSTE